MGVKLARTRTEIGLGRRAKTREKLIIGAAHVIARFGDQKATIDDFVQAAGVARGTFYNYFSTPKELFEALWSRIGESPYLEFQHVLDAIDDPAMRLAACARLTLSRARTDTTWGWLVYAMSAEVATTNAELRAFPTPDLEAGLVAGRFAFADLVSARDLVVATVRAGIRAVLAEGRPESYDGELCCLILTALGVRRSEARRLAQLPLPRGL